MNPHTMAIGIAVDRPSVRSMSRRAGDPGVSTETRAVLLVQHFGQRAARAGRLGERSNSVLAKFRDQCGKNTCSHQGIACSRVPAGQFDAEPRRKTLYCVVGKSWLGDFSEKSCVQIGWSNASVRA